MLNRRKFPSRRLLIWLALLAAVSSITAFDISQPPGVVFASAYAAIVVLAFLYLSPRQAVVVTVICTFATFSDGVFERPHDNATEELIERALALSSLWITAFFMYRRHRLASDLEQSQAKYQAIFVGAADGILMVDTAGTIISANPSASRMLGYETGELDGNPLDIIIPHKHRESHAHSVSEFAAGRLSIAHLIGVSREVEALRRDGTVFPIEINVSLAHSSGGRLFSAVIRDISERIDAARAIQEKERTLSTLMSHLPGMAYRCRHDDQWTMLFVSQGVHNLTGFEADEVTDNRAVSFEKLIYPADRDARRASVRRAVDAGAPYDLTYRIVHRSGEIRWVSEKGTAISESADEPPYLKGFIADITREKRVEEAMRESELRFRTIADSTPIMIWASGIDRQITFANRRVMEFTGLDMDELVGDGWLSQLHPDDVERVRQEYTNAFDAWLPFESEYRLKRSDGEHRWVVISGVPRFAPDGAFMGYIGSGLDIHERKLAELALRVSESRFRVIADSSPVMIWLTDVGGQGSFVNKTWRDFTGRPYDEELGQRWMESIHPDDRARVAESFAKSHKKRTQWIAE